MAKKQPKHRVQPEWMSAQIRVRAERAIQEGRFQTALDLAKQLFKQESTPANRTLLQKVYIGRAQQLRAQGQRKEACGVLENALRLGGLEPAHLEEIAQEFAACGETASAMQVLAQVPGSQGQGKVLARVADSAVQLGKAGRDSLPEDLRPSFDLVLKAFGEVEKGQDDAALGTLQGIGFQSPFLEWKLLLRGLSAFFRNEDTRAVENWQRLSPERLPARLIAPLRFRIDAAFRQSQPPSAQAALQKQADYLQNTGLVQSLRNIQKLFSEETPLPAFRAAEAILPTLRQQAPHLVPRLASCFYWTIVRMGDPSDIQRYKRLFGASAEDPTFARLEALATEERDDLFEAHHYWQQFERSIAANPQAWPGELGKHARALIWCRMGHNAAAANELRDTEDIPPFLRPPRPPEKLHPPAEVCFERSIELAPDQKDAYEGALELYEETKDDARAEKTARRLLERFPDDLETLRKLSEIRSRHGDYAEALTLLQQALKVNPLDRQLRANVANAHLFKARAHAENGEFDQARIDYQAALGLTESRTQYAIFCKWSACEFKAGNSERAEELLAQALKDSGVSLGVSFGMLIEMIRLKLPRKLKTRFDKEFKEGIAGQPTVVAAVAVARTAANHKTAGVQYHGQKTHEKKVLDFVERAYPLPFEEGQLVEICQFLLALAAPRSVRKYTQLGQRKFPRSPWFPFLEAESYVAMGPHRCPTWQANSLLARAQELARAMPGDAEKKSLLEKIEQRMQMLRMHGGLAHLLRSPMAAQMFEQFFERFRPDDLDDDDWE